MTDRLHDWALVAHELAGALSPVRNAVDILRSGSAGTLTGEAERLIGIASRGLERADRVLQNVVALAAPERHRARLEPIDAAAFLGRLQGEFATDAAARRVEIDLQADRDVVFPADATSLEQVVVNLVSNALKFTPPGGRVTLRARRIRGAVLPGRLVLLGGGLGVQPAFVSIEVRDTGIGLSPEARRHVFEPFYRAPEATQRGIPGSGLGLAVARRLAGLLHADLRPAPIAGGGARFRLTLPADEPTWELVRRIDATFGELAPRLERGPETLVVLRDVEGLHPWRAETVGAAVRTFVEDPRATVRVLSPTTWVVAAPVGVRDLLVGLAAALESTFTPDEIGRLRVHAQRARRGSSADERVLQGLVRCIHPLPRPRGRAPIRRHPVTLPAARDDASRFKEVADASRPARG